MKWRNSKERELLASGGSREQTLPNKNNPNPDLSDADTDKPKIDISDLSPINSPLIYGSGEDLHMTKLDSPSSQSQAGSSTGNPEYSNSADEADDEEINVT